MTAPMPPLDVVDEDLHRRGRPPPQLIVAEAGQGAVAPDGQQELVLRRREPGLTEEVEGEGPAGKVGLGVGDDAQPGCRVQQPRDTCGLVDQVALRARLIAVAEMVLAELAGHITEGLEQLGDRDVARLVQTQSPPAEQVDHPTAAICPYKGLARFEPDDAAYFFGRERLVAELVTHLIGAGLLGVVGPSGSGKSSLVHAGLLPRLARQPSCERACCPVAIVGGSW